VSGGRLRLAAAAGAFLLWSAGFIAQTSFVALDGHRHFCLFDDAMISLRYGWNLAHGHGLVWNPGGERVEGITNLLTTFTMALWSLLGDKDLAVLSSQIFGVACMLGTAAAAVGIAREVSRSEALRIGPVAASAGVLAYYPLAYWSLMGMETGLVAVLLSTATWLVLVRDGDARSSLALAVVLFLAWLARPDTVPAIATLLVYRGVRLREAAGSVRAAVREAALVAAACAGVSVARWSYYGAWVPNTYVLKMAGFPLAWRLRNGLAFLAPYWPSVLLPMVLAALAAIRLRSRRVQLLGGLFVVGLLAQIYVGGDAWPLWRMTAPYFPMLWVATLAGLAGLFARRERLLPLALTVILMLANRGFWSQWILCERPFDVEGNRVMVNIALLLSEVTTPDATLGVVRAGAVVYFSERPGIDFLGKSDRHVAALPGDLVGDPEHGRPSLPGHNKYDLRYSIEQLQPTYVSVAIWGRQDLRDFVRAHYAVVTSHGVPLVLRDGDPRVRWERVTRVSSPPAPSS
jgi:hypothetical protein